MIALIVGYALSRVLPPRQAARADADAPVLHPIILGLMDPSPVFRWSTPGTPYLDSMRVRFDLDEVIAGAKSDYEIARALTHWTHNQWEADATREPQHLDPIRILDAAAAGEQFRCDEYAVVLSGALNAVGLPARVVHLRRADADVREHDAGFTIAEAYLRDAKRWVMLDSRWDMIPLVKNAPASAFQLKSALAEDATDVAYSSLSRIRPDEYSPWIQQYLHYIDARLDQRIGGNEVRALMLVPRGSRPIRRFQRRIPLNSMIYTHAPSVFYPRLTAAIATTGRSAG
jgi:hypothetical protein